MEYYEPIDISIESVNNLIFESIRHKQDKKKADIPTIIKYVEREMKKIKL